MIKSALSLTVAVTTLSAGWFVGNRLSLRWSLRQKNRELELSSLNRLYELYGEFFAIWKLWNQTCDSKQRETASGDDQLRLLEKACTAEGQVEAFLLKLTTERPLKDCELHLLGRFRQAFQILREKIRSCEPLDWDSSLPADHPEYASLKDLTYSVACLLFASPAILVRDSAPDSLALLKVT